VVTGFSRRTLLHGVLIERMTVSQLVKKFLASYEAQKFITKFIRAHHWTLP
jgi:hypothetical protein